MTEKTLTTENIKPALDALRGELAPWPVVAKKQDRLNTAQLNAANSGITSSLVAQIIANTAAIRALESAITGTGLRALVVATLPAVGTTGILYIVPVTTYDPETDADVVNYSNEYIWIPVEGGTASEGHYEQVGQTGIVINNGQLTITVNGTSVGTFTANQSGDTTAAITVPTNADYVDRTTDQTVAGVKTFSSTIDGTAAKAIADEDGTSIKTGYGKLAGNQTWSGNNTYTADSYFKLTNYEQGEIPSSSRGRLLYFTDKNNATIGWLQNRVEASGERSLELYVSNKFTDGQPDINGSSVYNIFKVGIKADSTRYTEIMGNTYPRNSNTYSLGTSTNQWSSVYAQTYYYNGTEFQSKFVTTDTTQTINASKTINSAFPYLYIKNPNKEKGVAPSDRQWGRLNFTDKNNATIAGMEHSIYSNGASQLAISINNLYSNGTLNPSGTSESCAITLELSSSGGKSIVSGANASTDLGTSTNQWNKTYSKEYYYNGTAWGLDKANVWTQTNRYTGFIELQYTQSGGYSDIRWLDELDATIACFRNQSDNLTLGKKYTGKTSWYQGSQFSLLSNGLAVIKGYDGTNNSSVILSGNAFYPDTANINLGISSKKWKTLNGINPGALSLPDFTSETGVSLSAGANTYTPVLSGWLSISTTGDISVVCGNFCHKATDMISVPVIAGKTYTVTMPSAATGYFYSCLGNV